MENTDLNKASSSTLENNNTLSPEVWIKEGESYTMKPEIRERLLEISNDFYEFLNLEIRFYLALKKSNFENKISNNEHNQRKRKFIHSY